MDHQSHKFLKFLLQFVLLGVLASGQTIVEHDVIKQLFENNQYDRRVRPGNGGDAVQVTVDMYVRSIDKLENGEFDVQLTYRQKWKDERLSFQAADTEYLNLINPQALTWVPDTFFSNSLEEKYHDLMVRNEFVRVSPDGQVLQSARISLKLSCPMALKKFPFDYQTCPIRLASYGYTTKDVEYFWEKNDPIQLSSSLNVPKFTLKDFDTNSCNAVTNTGEYSCLRVDFTFKRQFSWYLVQVYIPCTMMVIISFLSFWIDLRAATARTVLLVVTLVVLAVQTAAINKDFPVVSYTKAVDVWTGICLTFVMSALVEFIVVQHLARRQTCNNTASTLDEEEAPLKEEGTDTKKDVVTGTPSKLKCVFHKYVCNSNSQPDKIDGVSRVLFPVLFVIFVVIYSIAYCPSSA